MPLKISFAVVMKYCGLLVLLCLPASIFAQNKYLTEPESKPLVLGKIVTVHSKILNEDRILNIYLPEGYKRNDTTRYPVIYLLDGSADEDFIHIAGLVQFDALPWVKRLPKSIVVGIANVDRKRDFTYPTNIADDKKRYPTTGGSANFISFLKDELQAYVEQHYAVNNSKTIIGQSLGGLLATEILLKYPYTFNKYIIISPSLWWDDGSLLKTHVASLKGLSLKTLIYVGVGKEGLGPSAIPHVMEVDANLLVEKLNAAKNKNLNVYFDYLPAEDHGTITHRAVSNAFEWMIKN